MPQVTVPESYDAFKGLLLDLIYDRSVQIEPATALQASGGGGPRGAATGGVCMQARRRMQALRRAGPRGSGPPLRLHLA